MKEERNLSLRSIELKKSIMSGSKILYPGSKFLLKKLKRIINGYMRDVFKRLKRSKKIIINLNIIKLISNRFLYCSFFNIKNSLQLDREREIEKKRLRNKKSDLIFYGIFRMIRNRKRKVFNLILNYVIRDRYQ
jgi:hypothetical protein